MKILLIFLTLFCINNSLAQDIQNLYKSLKNSVVIIKTKETLAGLSHDKGMTSMSGMGSGFLYSADGLIITAAHVVESADWLQVEYANGATTKAKVIASASLADVALIKADNVPATGVTPVKLANSDKVAIGEQVIIIGAPLGMEHSLSVGHISAKRQQNNIFNDLTHFEFIQTDAAINQGNSGGPMFNMNGQVVGIVSHILSFSGGFEGLGFVASSNMAQELLIDRQSMWTGIDGIFIHDNLAKALNLPQEMAVLIQKVTKNSPAARMGLRGGSIPAHIDETKLLLGGDFILAVDNIKILASNLSKIKQHLDSKKTGDQISVSILREGQKKDITIAKK